MHKVTVAAEAALRKHQPAQLNAFLPGVIYLFVPPATAPAQNTRRSSTSSKRVVNTNIARLGVGKWFV